MAVCIIGGLLFIVGYILSGVYSTVPLNSMGSIKPMVSMVGGIYGRYGRW